MEKKQIRAMWCRYMADYSCCGTYSWNITAPYNGAEIKQFIFIYLQVLQMYEVRGFAAFFELVKANSTRCCVAAKRYAAYIAACAG